MRDHWRLLTPAECERLGVKLGTKARPATPEELVAHGYGPRAASSHTVTGWPRSGQYTHTETELDAQGARRTRVWRDANPHAECFSETGIEPATNRRALRARRSPRGRAHRSPAARRGPPDSDDGPSDGPGEAGSRLCVCGCGADLDGLGKRTGAKTATPACRQRISRVARGQALDEDALLERIDELARARLRAWSAAVHRPQPSIVERLSDDYADLWERRRKLRAAQEAVAA